MFFWSKETKNNVKYRHLFKKIRGGGNNNFYKCIVPHRRAMISTRKFPQCKIVSNNVCVCANNKNGQDGSARFPVSILYPQ